MSELDALDPIPEQIKLESGAVIVLESLRARQFFKLLRIVTHGAMPILQDMSVLRMDPNADATEFAQKLLSLLVLSIPDAEDETIDFIRAMCKPLGLIEGRKLNKQDAERNSALWSELDLQLENPELGDMVTIIEAIIRRESADIQALGKRLAAMMSMAEKTGQLSNRNPSSTTKISTSSAGSPEPSISSPASTDGPTPPSATSPSADSASVSQPSVSADHSTGGSASSG